ncbi:MAG: hypothetical protein Aurels2KO_24770 [Aureliella sp.]
MTNNLTPFQFSVLSILVLALSLLTTGCNKVAPTGTADDPLATSDASPASADSSTTDSPSDTVPIPSSNSLTASPLTDDRINEFTPPPGVEVQPPTDGELVQPIVVTPGAEAQNQSNAPEIENQSFATILPSTSQVPSELIEHIGEVDNALEDLVIFGQRDLIEEDIFLEGGRRLGQMKLVAAEKIIASSDSTAAQRKVGKVAKLVALSHLGGLQDVAAARQLNDFARELSQSDDPDLEHQGRVVLLGFEVQSLQNNLTTEPANLVVACEQLLKSPDHRKFPELMAVQNAASVMHQMGFSDATFATLDLIAGAYQDSPDKNLRDRSWAFAIGSRPVAQEFFQAMKSLDAGDAEAETVAAAAQELMRAHPLDTTAEQLALTVGNIESAGHIEASQRIAAIVAGALEPGSMADFQLRGINELLEAHKTRTALIGQRFSPPDALTFEGNRLDTSQLVGKVVLVEFWSSENIVARQEMIDIASVYHTLADQGFEVIAMNLDSNMTSAEQFLAEADFPWVNVRPADSTRIGPDAAYAKAFGANQIPFSFLVDKDGTIAKLHVRGRDLVAEVENLLR